MTAQLEGRESRRSPPVEGRPDEALEDDDDDDGRRECPEEARRRTANAQWTSRHTAQHGLRHKRSYATKHTRKHNGTTCTPVRRRSLCPLPVGRREADLAPIIRE